jgi:hypothetical protein
MQVGAIIMNLQHTFDQNETSAMVDIYGNPLEDPIQDYYLCYTVEDSDLMLWKNYCRIPSIPIYGDFGMVHYLKKFMRAANRPADTRFGLVPFFYPEEPVIPNVIVSSEFEIVWFSQQEFLTGFTVDDKPAYLIKHQDLWEIRAYEETIQGGFGTLDSAMITLKLIGKQRHIFLD